MSRTFPHLYRSLYTGLEAPWRTQLRETFETYVRAGRPELLLTLSSRDRMYKRMRLADEFVTVSAVAGACGATPSAVRRAIGDLDIKPTVVRQGNGRTCLRVARDHAELLKAEINRRPDLYLARGPAAQRNSQPARRRFLAEVGSDMEAAYAWFTSGCDFPSRQLARKWPSRSIVGIGHIAERLGISRPSVTKLRDAGLFNGHHASRGQMHAIVLENYASLEIRLANAVQHGNGAPGRPLMAALQGQLKRVRVDLCEVLGRILGGKLGVVGLNLKERGLNRLLLSAEDLAGLVAERDLELSQGELSAVETTRRLGFADPNIVTGLVKAGLLTPTRDPRRRTEKLRFRPAEIERLNRTVISLREIAQRRLFGRFSAPGVVTAWLARRGIRPVCGPDLYDVPAIFFDRDDVERLSWFSGSRAGE